MLEFHSTIRYILVRPYTKSFQLLLYMVEPITGKKIWIHFRRISLKISAPRWLPRNWSLLKLNWNYNLVLKFFIDFSNKCKSWQPWKVKKDLSLPPKCVVAWNVAKHLETCEIYLPCGNLIQPSPNIQFSLHHVEQKEQEDNIKWCLSPNAQYKNFW